MDRLAPRLEVDPRLGRAARGAARREPVRSAAPSAAPQLRGQRARPASAAGGSAPSDRLEQLVTGHRPRAVGGEVHEASPPLTARQAGLEPLARSLDRHASAQLDPPRWLVPKVAPRIDPRSGATTSPNASREELACRRPSVRVRVRRPRRERRRGGRHHRGAHPRRPPRPRRQGHARRPPWAGSKKSEPPDPGRSTMSATKAAPFDPSAYKATTREQWQQAAEPWHRWGPTLEAWLGEATETMLDLAGVARGRAGARRRRGRRRADAVRGTPRWDPTAHVLATDRSAPAILDYAEAEARSRRPRQRRGPCDGDAEALDLEARAGLRRRHLPARADVPALAARPRWRACAACCVPGGRLGADRLLHARPQWLLQRPGGDHPPSRRTPGAPVAGARARSTSALTGVLPGDAAPPAPARSRCEPSTRRCSLPAAADCLRLEQESFGALHQMLSGLRRRGSRGSMGRGRRPALERLRGSRRLRGPVRAARGRRHGQPGSTTPSIPAAPPCGPARRCSRRGGRRRDHAVAGHDDRDRVGAERVAGGARALALPAAQPPRRRCCVARTGSRRSPSARAGRTGC